MTCKELLAKWKKSEHWSLSIFDMTGMIQYAYINDHYTVEDYQEYYLNKQIEEITIGFNSVYVKININIDVKFDSKEEAVNNGYHLITAKQTNYSTWKDYEIYAKSENEFAIVIL